MRRRLLLAWGYFGEGVLAAIVYWEIMSHSGPTRVRDFIGGTSGMWIALTTVLLGMGLAILVAFASFLSKPFGAYLRWADAVTPFTYAFAVATGVFFTTTVALIIAAWSKDDTTARISLFLLLYAGANFVSMIQNLVGLYRLHVQFEESMESERGSQRLSREE